jgi:hypothetical protein
MTAHASAAHAPYTMRNDHSHDTRSYFTDGGRLYRFLACVARSRKSMVAAVEDCRSLEILLITGEDLKSWRKVSARS